MKARISYKKAALLLGNNFLVQVVLINLSSNESFKNYLKHDQIYFVLVFITF